MRVAESPMGSAVAGQIPQPRNEVAQCSEVEAQRSEQIRIEFHLLGD